jgi:thiosulfate dehydrogenase [quinone] large subunit
MATSHGLHFGDRFHGRQHARTASASTTATLSAVGVKEAAIALVRVGTGFVFLWAFLDKTFGLGYSTPSSRAWIHGGSPTRGFLAGVDVGPFQSWFNAWAGHAWADWLFMIGLAGIGVALVLGIGVRIAALAGIVLVAFMWFAVFPPAKYTSTGAATGSTNPFVDQHVMDALALVAVAAFGAANRFGLGALWAKLPFVKQHHILL